MATLADIRRQYPDYKDLSDEDLAGKLHQKFYSDIPREQFNAKIGLTQQIDFNRPIEEVRADIDKLGPEHREKALEQWANAYVAKEREQAAKSQPQKIPGVVNPPSLTEVGDFVRRVARGTIVGSFADEANALTSAALHKLSGGSYGAPYDESVAYQRAVDRIGDRESPVASTVTQIAGGLATGAPIANAVMGTGKTVLNRTALGLGAGGLYGYLTGLGNAEGGLSERNEAGLKGAVIGGALGAAAPSVASAVTQGVGKLTEAMAPQVARWRHGPDAAAETVLARQMQKAGVSPLGIATDLADGAAAAKVGRGNSVAELPEMIADTSNALQRVTGSVYRTGGEAGNLVKTRLEGRQRGPQNPYAPQPGEPKGQMAHVMDAFDRALGISTAKGAHRTEQQILGEMKEEAGRFYKRAINESEPFDLQPALDGLALKIQQYPPPFAAELSRALALFVNPTHAAGNAVIARINGGLQALAKATTEAAQQRALQVVNEGFNAFEAVARKSNRPFAVDDIRRFDYAKRALDALIERAEPTMQRELVQFKKALLDQVHLPDKSGMATRNISYQKARDTYVEGYAQKEALELGRKALNENSDVTLDQFKALDEGQRRMFRIGLREAARSKMASMKPGSDVTQIFQQQRVQEILNEAIPGRTRPERFGEYMRRQQRMVQTRNQAIGGSQTAERTQDDLDFSAGILSQMWSRFKDAPSFKGALIESIGAGLQKALAFRQDVAVAMAKRLLETDRDTQIKILTNIQKRMGPDRFAQFADQLDVALAAAARVSTIQSNAAP